MWKIRSAILLSSLLLANGNALAQIKEENLCHTILETLQQNGYSEIDVYTPAAIIELLLRSNITPPEINTFNTKIQYKLSYSCHITRKIAYPKLIAVPLDPTMQTVTTILHWKATKPSTYY